MTQQEYNLLPNDEKWRLHYLAVMDAEVQSLRYVVSRESNFPGKSWAVSADRLAFTHAKKLATTAFSHCPALRENS